MTNDGDVAVVTGGSTGIGFETVRSLLAARWRVAFFSQDQARVEQAQAILSEASDPERVHAETVDLRDADRVRTFFIDLAERWRPPSALVCNAGYSPKGSHGRISLADIALTEWEDVLRVNLTGALLCCQQVLPAMQAKRQGRIVMIGSVAGRTLPRIAGASYAASKTALASLTRSIAAEYGPFGVTANTVAPGRILSEMTGAPDSPNNRSALNRIPVGRLGQPADIARVVEFLLRPDSDFINGAVIDVNGGEFAAP